MCAHVSYAILFVSLFPHLRLLFFSVLFSLSPSHPLRLRCGRCRDALTACAFTCYVASSSLLLFCPFLSPSSQRKRLQHFACSCLPSLSPSLHLTEPYYTIFFKKKTLSSPFHSALVFVFPLQRTAIFFFTIILFCLLFISSCCDVVKQNEKKRAQTSTTKESTIGK